jgi:CheY-like chemotaxis protein
LDGYGASLEIRQFDKSVPIIAISANARSEVASQIRKAGMNEFLPKPVTMTQLDELVGKYLKSTSTSIAN